VLTAVIAAALALLRRRPTVAWVPAAGALALGAAAGDYLFVAWIGLAPVHAFGAAWHTDRRVAIPALATLLASMLAGLTASPIDASPIDEAWVPYVLLTATAWGVGRSLRSRERLAAGLAERARELEEEREAYSELSVRYERARIASELHDIVAHAISVMVVQAGAGQRLAAVDPEGTAEAFGAIAAAARQAEQDMGRLVTLLADEEPIGPSPDLALVEELVARAAGSGLDVSLRLSGDREGLPADVVEAAYRVVQESLTNALRYAAGATVWVHVRGADRALLVEVTNAASERAPELHGHGGGRGLDGLHARVGACGGSLEAGPTADGGWRVVASLPRYARV
jgi:signal transduction histidine kinase